MDFEAVPPRVHDCFHPLPPAEVLVPMVINLDVTDRSRKTALHHAAFNGHLEMLSLLQLKGASVRAVDRRDKTPLHFAAFMGEFQQSRFSVCSGLCSFVPCLSHTPPSTVFALYLSIAEVPVLAQG